MENLSNYLKELRISRNLSLRDVEKASGNKVSNAYLSQLESGKILQPSPHILQALAGVYQVEFQDVMAAAGYIQATKKNSSSGAFAFFNKQAVTPEEREELLGYLQFIRKRKKKADEA